MRILKRSSAAYTGGRCPSVNRFFKVYKPFVRAGILDFMTYRFNFICHLIGQILYCFIMFFVWRAVFTSSGENTFMGFSMTDMVVFLFITFLTQYLTASDGAFALGEEIRDGSVAMRMIKPVSFDLAFLFQELGNKIIMISLIFLPLVLGVEIYRFAVTGQVMFQIGSFLIYMVSVVIAYLVSFYFNVCYGFLAFFLKNLWGSNILKESIVGFLSGAVIPIAFMPPVVQGVLQLLPFASLSYTPVMIYMGRYSPAQICFYVGVQVFWLFAMWGISKLIWRTAVKRLCVQGG